ncbi:MAG: hypothetical protein HZC40_15275 [Chloroflexi bacterium]|nr:hypothetical protein [Chloroflexota bacterium]
MVFENFRDQSLDIDLTFAVASEDLAALIQAIRGLKDQLALNVEQVSPGDFIPLPQGYHERAIFIGRYGQLDVFHFDLYSTALSKIARGTEEDFADVIALLRADRIDLATLEQYAHEIQPRLATDSLKQDPDEFERKFQALRDQYTRAT